MNPPYISDDQAFARQARLKKKEVGGWRGTFLTSGRGITGWGDLAWSENGKNSIFKMTF